MRVLSTGPLEVSELIQEVHEFIDFIQTKGIEKISIMFGFNSNTDDIYKNIELDTKKLAAYFDIKVTDKVISVGYSDFFIRNDQFEFLLGNDMDLIFRTENKKILNTIKSKWEANGYKVYESKYVS
jgi:hypothetical protein